MIRTLRGHEVTALRHCHLDITDREAVGSAIGFSASELVVNAAAYNDVDGAETHIEAAEAIIIRGPRILAEESATKSVTIVQVSTDYVFDDSAGRPYHMKMISPTHYPCMGAASAPAKSRCGSC